MSKATKLRGVTDLEALYAQVPTVACQGKCTIACGGVSLTELEARRLQAVTHVKPRTIPVTVDQTSTGRCVYLTATQRCGVYTERPLICRAWGVLKTLSCMHGCVPDRWLGTLEYVRLARAVERIGGRMLRTTPDGLAQVNQESYIGLGQPTRSDAAIAANDERTRNLRALHGGHILVAVDERDQ